MKSIIYSEIVAHSNAQPWAISTTFEIPVHPDILHLFLKVSVK